MYKNNHRRNSLCSMDWTETKFEYLGLELFGQCKTCEYDWKCCRWSFRKGCNWKLFSYTSAANGLVQSEFQPKIYPELSCCVCVIINMKLPRFTRNYNGWSRSFNGGDKMLSHAVAQIESRSLWRRHQRACRTQSLRWTTLWLHPFAPADHSIAARVNWQLWARNHLLLLLLLPVVFHLLLIFTTLLLLLLLLLLLPLVILPHPLRLLLLPRLLPLRLLQRPLWRQRCFCCCWRLCLVVRPCSVVQLVRLQVVRWFRKS